MLLLERTPQPVELLDDFMFSVKSGDRGSFEMYDALAGETSVEFFLNPEPYLAAEAFS